MPPFSVPKRLAAEFLGTALLLAVVVGSGIMGQNLAGGITGVALLANAIATGAALVVLILILGPVSGCHINPAVTLSFFMQRAISGRLAGVYVGVQVLGGIAGVVLAHVMFGLPPVMTGLAVRDTAGEWVGEIVATFGLVLTIMGCLRFNAAAVPYAVGLYITAGYWFTSSTSFANPAVTIARALTGTFAGIRPEDVAPFLAAQVAGTVLATVLGQWLFAGRPDELPEQPKYQSFPVEEEDAYGPW